MNGPERTTGPRRRALGSPVRWAMGACVAVFAWAVLQFYQPGTGFSSLIAIGDQVEPQVVSALRRVPHFVHETSAGYDGVYYVQLALYPTLDSPELKTAIDNLPYRARRMLFCWAAWLLGLGQPAWIVQAHALLNVVCWFALGWVLLRWFPATSWDRFFRWFAVMFCHGVCMSVHDSLVDAPSLLLVALAMRALETGHRGAATGVLALAGLGKETSVLAVGALADLPERHAWRSARAWGRFAVTALAVVTPLLVWIAYVRWKIGPADDAGLGNFTRPFAGLTEKWTAALADLVTNPSDPLMWATALAVLAITAQFLFFALRWRPAEAWWRVGAAFAGMMVFLSTPVWEGYPGAFTRVLLPMTLAFNVLVPRGRRWLPLLMAGNLSVLAAVGEFNPPHELYHVRGDHAAVAALQIDRGVGWYGVEHDRATRWRWSTAHATLPLRNVGPAPLVAHVRGRAGSARDARSLQISIGGARVWSAALDERVVDFQFDCPLPPGETTLTFDTDRPARRVGGDARLLAFRIFNLEIVVQPVAAPH
jgi:hypothetical protein